MRMAFLITLAIGVWFIYHNEFSANAITLPPPTLNQKKVWQTPVQKNLSGNETLPFHRGKMRLLAEYEITARVLHKKYYDSDRMSKIVPLDLAVGWKKMANPKIYNKIDVSQRDRYAWFAYRRRPLPIQPNELTASTANIHIIPANRSVSKMLEDVEKGQILTLKGYLVHYREDYANGGWWEVRPSSLSRTDTGMGACEVMYVEHVVTY